MTSVPLVPDVPGQADFRFFSDAEIQAYLIQGGNNPMMATGFAYLAWSRDAAKLQMLGKTDDLQFDTTDRAKEFRLIADEWFNRANNVEWFDLGPTSEEVIDVRDYMYPTGGRTVSDIFYEVDAAVILPDALL
jgi:hypothetical protein